MLLKAYVMTFCYHQQYKVRNILNKKEILTNDEKDR